MQPLNPVFCGHTVCYPEKYSTKSEKKRNSKVDFLRAIAIFLVLWGHSIQYTCNGKNDVLQNPLFIFIYSFHMPLFMMISGWVFYYSFYSKALLTIIIGKYKQLVVPVILWTITVALIKGLVTYKLRFYDSILNVSIRDIYHAFWFLTVLFVISVFFSIIAKLIPKYQLVTLCTFGIILFLLPDAPALSLKYVKYLYPYFLLGFYSNKYKLLLHKIKFHVGLPMLVIFLLMLYFWKNEYYIYDARMSFYGVTNLLNWGTVICYRYLAGLAGIGSVFFLVNLLPDNFYRLRFVKYVLQSGLNSFGTYIMSSYIFSYGISIICFPDILIANFWFLNFLFTLLLAVILSFFCNAIIYFLNKNEILRIYYLGGR
jgi:fucose 4-O-acetylase-like acetyltransferase